MDEPTPALGRAGLAIALLLVVAFTVVFAFGATLMVLALREVVGLAPASGWSVVCALLGFFFQLTGIVGYVMVANALAPYTGLLPLAMPRRRGHADHY